MVDSVQSTSANSLLRAQQTASTQALNNARPQTIINQTRAAAVVPVKASSVPQTTKIVSANSNLPRGSIVDKLV
jgi:hypothetical protein